MKRSEAEDLLQYFPPGTSAEQVMAWNDESSSEGSWDDAPAPRRQANPQSQSQSLRHVQPTQHRASAKGVSRRIFLDDNDSTFREADRRTNTVDRSERATTEQVMDPRTRLILYRLVNSGTLAEVHGCVSTGKEANVYYSLSGQQVPLALKIYKTSILTFRDRDAYVKGEFRFQTYCKANPRKMVQTWAEKEARNLRRLHAAGLRVPWVHFLKGHVLGMTFLGSDGWPSPRLKDVAFSNPAMARKTFFEMIGVVRGMYRRGKLVHGDLSEFNVLVHHGALWVIDVSQAVENDHPRAWEFLRRDIENLRRFFRARGAGAKVSARAAFEISTTDDPAWGDTAEDTAATIAAQCDAWERGESGTLLESLDDTAAGNSPTEDSIENVNDGETAGGETPAGRKGEASAPRPPSHAAESAKSTQEADERVFLAMDLPTKLSDVGEATRLNGDVAPFVLKMLARHNDEKTVDDEGSEEEDEDEVERDDADEALAPLHVAGTSHLSRDERRAHQKAVKEQQRARREEKSSKKKKKR